MSLDLHNEEPAAIQTHIGAIFISLELSFEMADHFAGPRRRTEDVQALGRGGRPGRSPGPLLGDPRQGFGSDGKILSDRRHSGSRARRVLDPPVSGEGSGIESHVVDAASIAWPAQVVAAPRPTRSMAKGRCARCWRLVRGEPRVCSMVRVPTPQDEDRRRICRERKTLTAERIRHVNRIKGLLFSQGIGDYAAAPIDAERWRRLARQATGVRWART